ncbi:MAG TPA: leucine--tRNA ligase [Actinomycetota bacterium]|nr:leucine--tRNA ligase [Actinomycetota bacterium]
MTQSEIPPYRYTAALAERIELAWQDRWERDGTFHVPNPSGPLGEGFEAVADRPKFYLNDMFSYPSGDRLHVGHTLGYVGTDVFGRYLRMRGHNLLHTMGFDTFGLPAEQYAITTGQHPRATTERNVEIFRAQLRRLGLAHDPRRGVLTSDMGFYRWTQWIFLRIFNAWYDRRTGRARPVAELVAELDAGERQPDEGTNPFGRPWARLTELERRQVVDAHRLAFLHEAPVNWCPGLGTVLANEEVTADGRSERGNFPVFRRPLRQWTLRITAYAQRLLDDLDRLDWPESVKQIQRNWIGRSEGALIRFPSPAGDVEVFTTRPDTVFGATFTVLAPEHPMVEGLRASAWPPGTPPAWTGGAASPAEAIAAYRLATSRRSELDRQAEAIPKTGVFLGSYATNPVSGASIPVFIADYVLMGYGTGAIMAVPGQDGRDWAFAEEHGLPIVRTVAPPEGFDGREYLGDGPAINSGFLDGLPVEQAKRRIVDWLEEHGAGRAEVTWKLRDWLFARQRYWGEPFPIVYDEHGLPVALPDSMLPVVLPDLDLHDFTPSLDPNDATSEPRPPLARATDWAEVTLDLGEGPKRYRREVNTMPQWAGSCWYELRYIDPAGQERFVDRGNERYWMGPRRPGDTGGIDLYVGGVEHAVLHLLYARFWQKVLYDLGEVSASEPFHRLVNQGYIEAYAYTDERGVYVPAAEVTEVDGGFRWRGQPVRREYRKMGKSEKNGVTPDELYAAYGADTLRLHMMFTGPLAQSRPWDTRAISGSHRLLQRLWRTIVDERSGACRVLDGDPPSTETLRLLHRTVAGVRAGIEALRFNTAVARITELSSHLASAYPEGPPRAVAEPLALLLAPLAPHLAEELWSRMGHGGSLAFEPFPEADPAYLAEETVTVPVQVNGKLRATLSVPAGTSADDLEAAARADERVRRHVDGHTIRKVIVVDGEVINFVVR